MSSYRKDVIPLNDDFKFNILRTSGSSNASLSLHFHDCLELNFIEAGSGMNIIENQTYSLIPGDIYVINNLEHHMAICENSLSMLVIVFDPDFIWQTNPLNYDYLKPFFYRNLRFSNRISLDDKCSVEIRNIISKLDEEWTERATGYQLAIKALLMYLLALLYRHYTSKDELGDDIKQFHSSYDKIRPAVEYLHQNFTEDIALEHLAKLVSMNKSYFSSYFKSVTNKTVTSYLESLRLSQACLLMTTTQKTLTEIALDSGFNSISYFNRAFSKLYGVSPNTYRKHPNTVQ